METNEIFHTPFWANDRGLRAIQSQGNRDKANAIMLFGQTFFKSHFPSMHPVLHTDTLALMLGQSNLKAIALPRGHAKSTIVTFLLTLYRIVFQERKFIVIVSESEDKAKDFVVRMRDELEYNAKLIKMFAPTGKFKTTDWSKTDFTTETGIRVVAKGAGQSLRGLIHKDTRPDMIVLDDIETNETAGTEAVVNFILTDVIPSANRRGLYDICYVGTIIRDMSALHRMLINDQWSSAKYECIDDDDNMIAPMLLPRREYNAQKKMYKSLGKMSIFYAENHNNPMVADDELTFKQEYFQHIKRDEIPTDLRYYVAMDMALPPRVGSRKAPDRTAMVVLGVNPNDDWYVVQVIANRKTPAENRKLLASLMKKYKPYVTWMETIAAQRVAFLEMQTYMKAQYIKFPFREIVGHSTSKEARIEQLQPMYESRRVFHVKGEYIDDLERELMLFGRTPHDDISDALSFFIGRAKAPRVSAQKVVTQQDIWDIYFKPKVVADWKVV